MSFRVSDRYVLEIHWCNVTYEQEGVAKLDGCYLSGPVIKEVLQMNQRDSMSLDFTSQYKVLVDDYYTAKFSWEGVSHTPNIIYLSNTILVNKYINSVPKLRGSDYIVVDTSQHTTEKHQRFLTYPSYLIKSAGDRYDFRS